MNRLIPRCFLACLVGLLCSHTAVAQRQMEILGRGVVAVRTNSTQVYVGWRLLGNDLPDVAFNLYRSANGVAAIKVNASPLAATSDYLDTPGNLSTTSYTYSVRPVVAGAEVTDIWANPLSGLFTSGPANYTDTDTAPPPPSCFYRIVLLP